MNDIFEDVAFDNMQKGIMKKTRTAFSGGPTFEQRVASGMLTLDTLAEKCPDAVIKKQDGRYDIRFQKARVASDIKKHIAFDNADIDLMFSEDLMDFEPDEDLIIKSKVPLWVIKPLTGGKRVLIQRMW